MDRNLIREAIVVKLKELNAYIDNELPDYIMVMLANKKTIHQISDDLNLFLGDDTNRFTHWLQTVLDDPSLLTQKETSGAPPPTGSKRPTSQMRSQLNEEEMSRNSSPATPPEKLSKNESIHDDDDDDDIPLVTGVQRIKLPPERNESSKRPTRTTYEPKRSRDQDLRSLIRRRKAEAQDDEDDSSTHSHRKGGVSSIVKVPEKPERPKESRGTSRLLQRAIHDIHTKKNSSKRKLSQSSSSSNTVKPQEVNQKEEKVDQIEIEDYVDEFTNEEKDSPTLIEQEEEEEVQEQQVTQEEEEEDNEEESDTNKDIEVATLAAVKKVLPQDKKSDLRLFLNKGKKKQEVNKDASSTRFVVTMEGVQGIEEEEEEESIGKTGMAERCRFWPNCKNGDNCSFHHPTVPCRLFPNCKYGQKCCFVHPVCKFDGRCMKPDCPYLHTVAKIKVPQPRFPYRIPPPVPVMYNPGMMLGGGGGGRGGGGSWSKSRYPNKQSLKWTPAKPINERKFAVSDNETTSMPVQ